MNVRASYIRLLTFRASGALIQNPKLSTVLMPGVRLPGMRATAGEIRTSMDLVQAASEALGEADARVRAIALVNCPNRRLVSSPGPYGQDIEGTARYHVGYAIRAPGSPVASFTTCRTLAEAVRHVVTFVRMQRFAVKPDARAKRAPRRTSRPGRHRR